MRILQKGFNYSQDGPGNRLVYHLQGCNFRCRWCSNPESMPIDSDAAKNVPDDEVVDEINRTLRLRIAPLTKFLTKSCEAE